MYQIKNYLKDTSGDSLILWGDAIYKKEAVQRMIAIHQIFHNDFWIIISVSGETGKSYALLD